MRETGIIVNNVPRIHIDPEESSSETHCIVAKAKSNGVNLKIPLKLDGVFLYFPRRKLTQEEISAYKYIETLGLCAEGNE